MMILVSFKSLLREKQKPWSCAFGKGPDFIEFDESCYYLQNNVQSTLTNNYRSSIALIATILAHGTTKRIHKVDERPIVKHFEWPEKKPDSLREATFGYRDLKKLEQEVSNYIYKDDLHLSCDSALKRMTAALSERMERTVHNILRTRDSLMRNCNEFRIPTDWILVGILSKIKFGSVKLAKMYMKRAATELQSKGRAGKDSFLDYMLLQGVRFAFRIHQFAGGFDSETMHAFEKLRDFADVLNKSRD